MSLRKTIRLTFELLSNEDEERFSIHSKKEIQFILKSIAKQGGEVALYYGNRDTFIMTTLLEVNHRGLWIEASQNQKSNEHIVQSRKFYFVSAHQHVKAQFISEHIEVDEFDGLAAFFMPLPRTLLRIQRRDNFRLPTPILNPLKCIIPVKPSPPDNQREFSILDISSGGIALICEESDTDLEKDKTYAGCLIFLPDDITINATLQVRNMFLITRPSGGTMKRVGCKFINLDGKMEILLQRSITKLQQNAIQSDS